MGNASGGSSRLLDRFRSVARDRLERLSADFVALEAAAGDEELATRIKRELHTLKGEARMMGLAPINSVAHHTEDVLQRALAMADTTRLGDLVLEGLDLMLAQVQALPAEGPAHDAFVERAREVLEAREELAAPTSEALAATPPATEELSPDDATGSISRPATQADETLRVSVQQLDDLTSLTADLLLRHTRSREHLRQVERAAREAAATVTRLVDLMVDAGVLRTGHHGDHSEAGAALRACVEDLKRGIGDQASLAKDGLDLAFDDGLHMDEVVSSVHELRFVPIRTLFTELPRAIRNLARDGGKAVKVHVHSGGVLIDKNVLELLREPLVHILRNCVDHGLETSEERRLVGKPASGTIRLEARRSGSTVELMIADDGRGVDLRALVQAAIDRGVLSRERAAELTPAEQRRLVFTSDLSTRRQVGDLSGRGVGLDAVQATIQSLGGTIDLESASGLGTTFHLVVPLSIVMSRVLLFETGGITLALPVDLVERVELVTTEEMELHVQGRSFRRDELRIPVISLGAILGLPQGSPRVEVPVVVVKAAEQRLGLEVSALLGERQVAQQPPSAFLRGMALLQGTIALPSGSLALLLNAGQLLGQVFSGPTASANLLSPVPDQASALEGTVLVVDDSEVTRDMLVSILLGLGLGVLEAVNGQQGLEQARAKVPDLVVTDLEMPLMDGFELINELRANARTAAIPVLVLSYRSREEDRARATALGAAAYLAKTEFTPARLEATLLALLGGTETP